MEAGKNLAKMSSMFTWGAMPKEYRKEEAALTFRRAQFHKRFNQWAIKWANMVCSFNDTQKLSIIISLGKVPFINIKNRSITLSYSDSDLWYDYSKWERKLWSTLGHECAHELYTNFDKYKKFAQQVSDDFAAEFPANKGIATKQICDGLGGTLANSCEDGRIETLFSQDFAAFVTYFRWSNLAQFKTQNQKPEAPFDQWERALIFLSVLGVPPLWTKKLPKTDPLWDVMNKVAPILNESCFIEDMDEATKLYWEVYLASKEYLKEALKGAIEGAPSDEEVAEALRNFKPDFSNTSGSKSSGGSSGSPGSGGSGGSSRGFSVVVSKDPDKDGKDGDGSGKGDKDGKDGDGSDKGDKDDKDGDGSGKGDKDSKDGDGSDKGDKAGKDGDGSGKGNKTSTGMGDNIRAKDSSGGATRADLSELQVDWEQLEKEYEKMEFEAENSAPQTIASPIIPTMSEELEYLYQSKGDSYVTTFQEIPREGWAPLPFPQDIKLRGRMLNQKLKSIRSDRAFIVQKEHGKINTRKLARYAHGDYSIFKSKDKHIGGLAGCIAWDGSGSMSGPKQLMSANACSLIECAFDDIPIKIINFSCSCTCDHYLVKDFDEHNKALSFAYGYAKWRGFNGGNKDGYSIRVLTREVLKRKEETKFLFVLSDGLPSDYSGGYNVGLRDVADAVGEAVKKGIHVIAIAFGSPSDRAMNHDSYKFMYTNAGATLIECSPQEIADDMAKALTKISLASK